MQGGRDTSFRDLEIFSAVAETGSFRRAASRLGVGQPSVSRRIARLEDQIGVSLFERSASGTVLTGAGQQFAKSARKIRAEIEVAYSIAKAVSLATEGELKIGSTISFSDSIERDLIKTFSAHHKDVRLFFFEATREEMLRMLSHRELDVVFLSCAPIDENGDGLILKQERVFAAVPGDGVLAAKVGLAWSDLENETFLFSHRDAGPDVSSFVLRNLGDRCVRSDFQHHDVSREVVMVLVGLGMGVSVIAEHATGVAYPNVSIVPIEDGRLTVPVSITWKPENDNPALRRFLSLARIEAKRNGVLS